MELWPREDHVSDNFSTWDIPSRDIRAWFTTAGHKKLKLLLMNKFNDRHAMPSLVPICNLHDSLN